MPGSEHEAVLELIRQCPAFVVDLLASLLGIIVPGHDLVRLDANDFTDVVPTEFRADAVVVLDAREEPTFAAVVEVQRRPDERKRYSWPVYLTTLRARHRCRVALVVICPDRTTADWCAQPIDLDGAGSRIVPHVLGPDQVPRITDAARAAAEPELAVFSAIDEYSAALYHDVLLAALPRAAREHLEALVSTHTYEYQSDFARGYYIEGQAAGQAEAVLRVLDARRVSISDEVRERIDSCRDIEQLKLWVDRAATAETVDDLFR